MKTKMNITRNIIAATALLMAMQTTRAFDFNDIKKTQGKPATAEKQTARPKADFDFRAEKSIWGTGPVHEIKPENEVQTAEADSFVNPFEKFDMGDLNQTWEQRNRELKKKLMKEREVKKTLPLIFDDTHTHLGISLMGGFSNMLYSSDFGDNSGSFSPGVMIDYYYFFHQKWGMRVGVGLSYSRSKFTNSGVFTDHQEYTDYEGDLLSLDYSIKDIKEKHSMLMMEVPVMAAYDYRNFIFAAGMKLGFPLNLKYDQTLQGVDITGQYPFSLPIYEAEAIGAMRNHKIHSSERFSELPVFIMGGLNIGYKYHLTDVIDLGASLFFDYSFNELRLRAKNDRENAQHVDGVEVYDLIRNEELTSPDKVPARTYNASVLCSKQMSTGKRMIEGMHYMNLGVKLSIYFSSYGNGTKEAREEIERKAALMK